jgi:hypothetical protein
MRNHFKQLVSFCFFGLLTAAEGARPDYYTAGFYTRGSDAGFYMDQGGVLDPFYIPAKDWALIPRVTLSATRDDNVFMVEGDETTSTRVDLIPGLLLLYGRPEHNHLYADTGFAIPLMQSGGSSEDGNLYFITVGGVKKTGKSQVSGRVGHRRSESTDPAIGQRIAVQDYTGDVGLEYRVSTKSSLGLNGAIEIYEFGRQGRINYTRYYGAGRFYRRMTSKSDWFVQGGIGMDDLDRESKGVYGDALFYDLSVGMRGKPSPKTTVTGRTGYCWRQYDDLMIGDTAGWISSLGVETTPFGFSTFYTELMSDIRPDVTAAGDYMADKRLTLGVNRRLFTERLRGDASLLFGTVENRTPAGMTEDEYRGFRLGLDWWLRKNLSLGAAYSYTERRSDGDSSYKSGQWTVRMSWNY